MKIVFSSYSVPQLPTFTQKLVHMVKILNCKNDPRTKTRSVLRSGSKLKLKYIENIVLGHYCSFQIGKFVNPGLILGPHERFNLPFFTLFIYIETYQIWQQFLFKSTIRTRSFIFIWHLWRHTRWCAAIAFKICLSWNSDVDVKHQC